MSPLLMAFCAVVIVAMVVIVGAVVLVGAFGRGYDIDACFAAYKARKAEGQVPNVMEPAEHQGLVS